MANGLPYNRWDPMIAANNWYPLGTLLKVTRQGTDRYIYVRVQDRGSRALTLDLSEAGFAQLGGLGEGRIPILLEVVTTVEGQAPRAVDGTAAAASPPDAEAPTDETAPPEETPIAPTDETRDTDIPAAATPDEREQAPTAPPRLDPQPLARHIRPIDGDIFAAHRAIHA
jgi:rare lipoprotein A (peptidoglycan hydrolase)